MHDGLGDLRADAADDAVGAHQARRRHGFDQVLRHQGIDRRHPGDVDDRDLGARGDDLLQQALHDGLGASAVERPDQRQRQNAIPQPDHRGRQFEQLVLLAADHLLAALLVELGREEAELVEQRRDRPGRLGQRRCVADQLALQQGKNRFLQRKNKARRLRRADALGRAVAGQLLQHLAGRRPLPSGDV